jgi:hypothetical protein
MTSFTIIEHAVKMGLITYKDIVEQLCETNKELAEQLFKEVSPAEDDPKVLRKMHKAAQVAKFGEDKEAIKQAMKAYDVSVKPPSEPKKRVPPIRVWTDADKVRTKAKNAFVKEKMKELGDDITLAEQKIKKKEFIAEFARQEAEEPEDEAEDEAEEDVEAAVETVEPETVEPAVEKVGLSDAEKKEWSALKKKDKDGILTVAEKARYKELKKKKE